MVDASGSQVASCPLTWHAETLQPAWDLKVVPLDEEEAEGEDDELDVGGGDYYYEICWPELCYLGPV